MYVGLDVHKRFCHGTMMNEEGMIVKQGKFSTDPRCLGEFMDGVKEATVVLEAGYCWQPVYEWLEEDGYSVKLAHPLKTKLIAEAKVKTDRIDSEVLAHLLRADLIPESWVPPKKVRALRDLVKRRAFLVRMRTKLKNKRQSIERVFSRLKSHFNLDNLRVRRLARVKQHALLSLTSMLVYALTAAKRGLENLVRSPTRLTA